MSLSTVSPLVGSRTSRRSISPSKPYCAREEGEGGTAGGGSTAGGGRGWAGRVRRQARAELSDGRGGQAGYERRQGGRGGQHQSTARRSAEKQPGQSHQTHTVCMQRPQHAHNACTQHPQQPQHVPTAPTERANSSHCRPTACSPRCAPPATPPPQSTHPAGPQRAHHDVLRQRLHLLRVLIPPPLADRHNLHRPEHRGAMSWALTGGLPLPHGQPPSSQAAGQARPKPGACASC